MLCYWKTIYPLNILKYISGNIIIVGVSTKEIIHLGKKAFEWAVMNLKVIYY